MIGIFGAGGFIGIKFLRRLADRGHAVRAVGRRFRPTSQSGFPGCIEFMEADLREAEKIECSLKGLDTVVHLTRASNPDAQK